MTRSKSRPLCLNWSLRKAACIASIMIVVSGAGWATERADSASTGAPAQIGAPTWLAAGQRDFVRGCADRVHPVARVLMTSAFEHWAEGRIHEIVKRFVAYPEDAAIKGWEGGVLVCLDLDRSGKLLRAAVIKSSGYAMFDGYALMLVGAAFSVAPAPKADRPHGSESQIYEFEAPVQWELGR